MLWKYRPSYSFINPRDCLYNWPISSFTQMKCRVKNRNFPYKCVTTQFSLAISRIQFYHSTCALSAKKRQFLNIVPSSSFEAESWEDEEKDDKGFSNHKIDNELVSSGTEEHNFNVRQDHLLYIKLKEADQKVSEITNEYWDAIKMSILEIKGSIDEVNIDALIIKYSSELSLSLCKSYFKYLKSTKKRINRATYGGYLQAFCHFSSSCTDDDLKEIVHVYNELITVYPMLDSYTAEKAVFALCLTKSWKEYIKLFKDIKQFYPPSISVYSVVIKTLFKNGENDLGWKLLDEMIINHGRFSNEVFISWLEENKSNEGLLRVLECLTKYDLKPSCQLGEVIMKNFNDINTKGRGTFSTILHSGVCTHCNAKLERAWVSKEDYNELKSAFLNPVLIGKDIFLKTQPDEFDAFQQFLKKTAPYDVVLDGLNIAFKVHKSERTTKSFAFKLKSVVRYFAVRNQKVLVFGRKHMEKWPKEEMNFINENAHVFLAEDISQDDPFLLYATLYSGIGTCFVSRDMMRGHKFLLADPKLKDTFQKWQAQHQYFITYIENNGTVHLKHPVPFMQTVQRNSLGDWHIPYEVREELTSKSRIDNYHKYWLCLTHHPMQQLELQRHNHRNGYTFGKRKVWVEKPVRREVPKYNVSKLFEE